MKNFSQLRKSKKIKQCQAAKYLKVSTSCFSQYETGKRQPPINIIPKLAELLNCSIEEFVFAIIETQNQGVSA